MAYSKLGIINMALYRIGVKALSSLTDGTPQQIQATAIWDYVLDELLEDVSVDWKFAKARITLDQRNESPSYDWDYAYALPHDFLRLAKSGKDDPNVYFGISSTPAYPHVIEPIWLPEGLEKITNGSFTGAATGWTLGTGWTYGTNNVSKAAGAVNTLSQIYTSMVSAPVVGECYKLAFTTSTFSGGSLIPQVGNAYGYPVKDADDSVQYIVAESATAGIVFTPTDPDVVVTIDDVSLYKVTERLALLSDYDNSDDDIYMTYIRRITDVTRFTARFVNALAFRLAAELAVNRTESREKYVDMMSEHKRALAEAKAHNQSLDYQEGEDGNDDWEMAGR